MFVFACAGCGAELTAALSRVELPVHTYQSYGDGLRLPVLMEPGTFAVEPERSGPPWRAWAELGAEEAAARGIFAPVVYSLPDGAPDAVVIAPGDVRNTRLVPERGGGFCCGLDGAEGPNMACAACGLLVASRIDDCSRWQAVWLAPEAVRRCAVGPEVAPLSWPELLAEGRRTPPFEPISSWDSVVGTRRDWDWSPRWQAAVGRALALLLVVSRGRPLTVPDGLVGEVFRRALDALLPPGPPARPAVLAGPGLPVPDPEDAVLLVPTHPQTGELWTPAGPAAGADLVPLPFGVWLELVSPEPRLPRPASGRLAGDLLRDYPLVPRTPYPFRADRQVFLRTLVRLPAVRSPWLRGIVDDYWLHYAAGIR
ncbi:hypothetical protein [Kitasatospora viridis]|uniref:Uncharacterized protein n=1 Tax=Kitasatospora viridis TaxID=281105 RepID=A0A561SDQ7_9ACTN|nr:hypothetical protein [Kitasatospora viridis]TWF72980.1 hypothetical protein FHX73_16131 [Kitasatospora viridis]